MTLIIGIPNSGKTTYSERFANVIHLDSTSGTRRKRFAHSNELAALSALDVCVEGVYNRRIQREELLRSCQHKNGKRICVWLDTPIEICTERERNYRHRPEGIVLNHAQSFEPPTYDEGWDEIIIVRDGKETVLER